MSVLSTPKKIKDFFLLLGCRTRIDQVKGHPELGNWPKIIIKVPKSQYHFVRSAMADKMPMGVLWDIQTLGFFENRITKYKFNIEEIE